MGTGVLDEAYQRLAYAGPEWGEDRLTNHGPMVVEVLARRGREDEVHRWLDRYLRRLEELPGPVDRITEANWREALGEERRVGDWTGYFRARMAEQPWRSVLETWWPRLIPGVLGGATHGVIRVGHAVRTLRRSPDSEAAVDELAHGLAHWAARSQAVPGADRPPSGPVTGTGAGAALDGVPRVPVQHGTVADRLGQLDGLDGWPDALAALRPPAEPPRLVLQLRALVDAAARRYASYGHASPVLLVHTATAPNAVLQTLPVLPPALWPASAAAVWTAVAAITAAYATAFSTDSPSAPGEPQAALDLAVAHGDEHVIKLTDTVMDVADWGGGTAALAASARAAALITSPTQPH
jgi:hypothetical protein